MRPCRMLALSLVALAAAGCVRKPGPGVAVAAPPSVVEAAVPSYYTVPDRLYRLGSGDKLRVVVFGQEGLTNSLKHAGSATADVTVDYGPAELLLEIRDDGHGVDGDGRSGLEGAGHGLAGIRERVKLFGGDLVAGPAPGGGFLVRARLPLEGGRP